MWTVALLTVAWLAAPPMVDASGRIVADDGKQVVGAEVCELTPGAAERCVRADAQGRFTITRTTHPKLLVRAKGFLPTFIDAAPLNEPVKLARGATLFVTITDVSTGKPLPEGRVMIDTPSGKRIGNFVPFNQSGVRISTLEPGIVFVRVESAGYAPGGPTPVELVRGSERSLTIQMAKKAGGKPH